MQKFEINSMNISDVEALLKSKEYCKIIHSLFCILPITKDESSKKCMNYFY